MNFKYLVIGFLLLVSCTAPTLPIDSSQIQTIEIYSLPQGALFPIDGGDSWIKHSEPRIIEDMSRIKRITDLINDLENIDEEFRRDDIYLRCNIRLKSKKVMVLDFNRFQYSFGDKTYKRSDDLTDALYAD